jgi:hypothetical protein
VHGDEADHEAAARELRHLRMRAGVYHQFRLSAVF